MLRPILIEDKNLGGSFIFFPIPASISALPPKQNCLVVFEKEKKKITTPLFFTLSLSLWFSLSRPYLCVCPRGT